MRSSIIQTEQERSYLTGTEAGRAQSKLPPLNPPPKLFSQLATPALLNRDADVSSPARLPLLNLGDAGPMVVQRWALFTTRLGERIALIGEVAKLD